MFSQRAAVKINDGHHRWLPEGSGNLSIRASCTTGAAFTIHRQQVTVIKCFFISSQATTKGQNRIKQSGGMLALLMPQPFENALAMRGSGMLQAWIRGTKRCGDTECSVGAVLLPAFISTSEPRLCFLGHLVRASVTSPPLQKDAWPPGAGTLLLQAGVRPIGDSKCKVDE